MKRLLALLPLFFFTGCYELVFLRYDVPMVSVERPSDVKEKYGNTEEITLKEDDKYFYSDSLIGGTR